MPASGHQDHTTSPSALALFVNSASASTASRSTSVTIASAPLTEQDGRSSKTDLGESRNGIFFARGLDSASRAARFDLPVGHALLRQPDIFGAGWQIEKCHKRSSCGNAGRAKEAPSVGLGAVMICSNPTTASVVFLTVGVHNCCMISIAAI